MNIFARIVSVVFHPLVLLFPTPYLLVEKASGDPLYALKWTLVSYVFVFAVAILVFLGVIFGFFSNFDVSRKEERPLLFSLVALSALFYLLSLLILDGPAVLFIFVFALFLGLIVFSIVNKKIKTSFHTAIISAFILLIAILYKGHYFLALALIPIIGWSRVKTKKHTAAEVILGAILGISLTLAVYFLSKIYFLKP